MLKGPGSEAGAPASFSGPPKSNSNQDGVEPIGLKTQS